MVLTEDNLRFFRRHLIDENPNPDEVMSAPSGKKYTARQVYRELERGDPELCEYMKTNMIENPEMRKRFPEAGFPDGSTAILQYDQ